MKKYLIIILSVLFVFISCQTSKDRTDRIHELYSGYCKEGNFICEANVLFECIDNTWELLQYCESQTCNYVTGKCEGEIDDADSTDIDITDIENNADEESDNNEENNDSDIDLSGNGKTLCTGQTKCYNETAEIPCPKEGEDFYGQDAQYATLGKCIQRSYFIDATNDEEIAVDDVTYLLWQQTISENTFTWQEAIDYCDELEYAKETDWRLPTAQELATLPDYALSEPVVSSIILPNLPSGFFWSSSSSLDITEKSWAVSFGSGHLEPYPKTSSYYAVCVRGPALSESIFKEHIINEKVLVVDSLTDLMWTKEYIKDKTWKEALNYCKTLNYSGLNNWRLPNINELKTFIDHKKSYPASSYSELSASRMWTSSTYVGDPARAWCVAFSDGSTPNYYKTVTSNVICVR